MTTPQIKGPQIKGWCPSAYRPMASGDGWVVRVRPGLGTLSGAQAHALADLAERYGNGVIDLTNRANLQIRGVAEQGFEPLIDGLIETDLLGQNPEIEDRLNILVDPFWASGDGQTALFQALCLGLCDPAFGALPSKFGFVIDAGPARRLADVSGDIRIETCADGLMVRADGAELGRVVPDTEGAVRLALDLARWFLASGGVGADGRGRMARHIASGVQMPLNLAGNLAPLSPAPKPVPGTLTDGCLIGLAFGQLSPADLRQLAEVSAGTLRLTPWRMVLLPGVRHVSDLKGHTSLLVDPDAALLRIQACTGAPGCPQATVDSRAVARSLAAQVPAGKMLHVSGCAKGCAHPKRAELTLVGRAGRFDLVKNGAPWDDPGPCGLEPSQLGEVIGD